MAAAAQSKPRRKAPTSEKARRLDLYRRRCCLETVGIKLEDDHFSARGRLRRIQSLLLATASERQEPANGPLENLEAVIHEKKWNLFEKRFKDYKHGKWDPVVQPQIYGIWDYSSRNQTVSKADVKQHLHCLLEAPEHFEKLSKEFRKAWLAARQQSGLDRNLEKKLSEVQSIFASLEAVLLEEALACFGGPSEYAALRLEKAGDAQEEKAWRRVQEHLGPLAYYKDKNTLAPVEFIFPSGELNKGLRPCYDRGERVR